MYLSKCLKCLSFAKEPKNIYHTSKMMIGLASPLPILRMHTVLMHFYWLICFSLGFPPLSPITHSKYKSNNLSRSGRRSFSTDPNRSRFTTAYTSGIIIMLPARMGSHALYASIKIGYSILVRFAAIRGDHKTFSVWNFNRLMFILRISQLCVFTNNFHRWCHLQRSQSHELTCYALV